MKEWELKNPIGRIYLEIFFLFIIAGFKFSNTLLLYIGCSALGLSFRAFSYVYIKKKEEKLLSEIDIRGCRVNYYLYYPLLILVVFSLAYIFFKKDLYDHRINALLSFYVGFDIWRVANLKWPKIR